jgi:hypothetical protein
MGIVENRNNGPDELQVILGITGISALPMESRGEANKLKPEIGIIYSVRRY